MDPENLEDIVAILEQKERRHFYVLIILIGIPFLSIFIFSDLLYGRYIIALFCMPILVLIGIVLPFIRRFAVTRKHENKYYSFFYYSFFLSVGFVIIYVITFEGYSRSPWFYIFPLLSFLLLGHNIGLILTTVVLFLLVVFSFTLSNAIPVEVQDIRNRFIISIIVIIVISYFSERWRYNYKTELIKALINQ